MLLANCLAWTPTKCGIVMTKTFLTSNDASSGRWCHMLPLRIASKLASKKRRILLHKVEGQGHESRHGTIAIASSLNHSKMSQRRCKE
mmetsp:Transcript_25614/g.37853  ORF Transcript_25614/g.37853 Transcript_25614/m.37853 type:complete len:88 (-) Transcript_25614:924-1187(-)